MSDTDTISTEKLDSLLRKVQGLLAQADHPNTDPVEAQTFRDKAEALMYKYRIDEATLAQGQPGLGIAVQWRDFPVCRSDSEFRMAYRQLASAVIDHFDIKGAFSMAMNPDDQTAWVYASVVGYESDVRACEVLFTACQLAFQAKLEPRMNPDLSQQENAYIMRNAGMEGWKIAMALFGRDDKHLRPKVRAMFKAEAIKRGEDPTVLLGKGNSVKTYRTSYAEGFASELWSRLRYMRLARGEEATGLVLAGRTEAIREAFYTKYPSLRPTQPESGFERYVSPTSRCAKCQKAKSGYCREHGYLRPRAARDIPFNGTAARRGRDAANQVDLGPGATEKFGRNVRGEL